jgi:tetratricopeptide (TPR) repeat protein
MNDFRFGRRVSLLKMRAEKAIGVGGARLTWQIVLVVLLIAGIVAGAAALFSSDGAQEWRLRQMSPAALEAAARERSWDPLLLYQLGLARARRGDHAGAALALVRAADADPTMARAHRSLGQELEALGRLPEAEVALRRAVQLNPHDRAARLALGDLYRRAGALGAAIALFQELARREADPPEALYRLAECYGDNNQPDRRLALLEQVGRRAPEVPRYQAALGSAYLYYGRLADAERCFRRALRQAPEDADLHYRWGRALVEQGDDAALPAAERELTEATRLRPGHADTHMALGQLSLRRGDTERARAELETATRLGHFEDRTLLLLGQTLLRLNHAKEGNQMLAQYRRTTDLNRGIYQLESRLHNAPGDRAARLRLARLYRADGQPERAAYHEALARRADAAPAGSRSAGDSLRR